MMKLDFMEPIKPTVRFGIELTEIYPPWYLHPSLKNLMYLAQVNYRDKYSSRFKMEEMLGKGGDGSVKEKLQLKEYMVTGKNILAAPVTPGVPVWLLRHFLGLLPTPIFTSNANSFYWMNFAVQCHEDCISSIKCNESSKYLNDIISKELIHLPERNLTLLFDFFELLRFLSMKSNTDKIDKYATVVLAKYFAPSLFVRPFRPGILNKKDRTLISLILYIIIFWHNIQPQILDLMSPKTCSKNNKLYFFAKYYEKKYRGTDIYLKDKGTQTCDDIKKKLVIISESENSFEENNDTISSNTESHFSFDKEFKNLDNKIAYSTPCTVKNPLTILNKLDQKDIDQYYEKINRNNCHFLHHVETQTMLQEKKQLAVEKEKIMNDKSKTIKYSYSCNKRRKTPKKIRKYKVFVVEIPAKRKKRNKKKVTFQNKSTVPKVKKNPLGKTQKNNSGDIISSPSSGDQKTIFSNTGGYIYDTFIGNYQNDTPYKMGFIKPTNSSEIATNFADSVSVNINQSLDMYERITKYGWTYTKSNQSLNNSPREVESIPDPYKICFDNDQVSNNSCSPLTVAEKKNKSVLGSLRKMKSKFMFWKDTSPMKIKKCVSYLDVSPNVKYKKISKTSTSKTI